jgi:hypothetical protein
MKIIIYIDFENVPNIELTETGIKELEGSTIYLFIGENQRRLSTDMVKIIQPLGKSVKWLQISGTGKNALDFHIAYYLALNKEQKDTEHYIVSRDAGFDPLIKHTNNLGQKVKRVVSFDDVFHETGLDKELEQKYEKIVEILKKQKKSKRPKSRKTLASFIENFFQKSISTEEIDGIIENLFRKGIIEEKNKRISYLDS